MDERCIAMGFETETNGSFIEDSGSNYISESRVIFWDTEAACFNGNLRFVKKNQ